MKIKELIKSRIVFLPVRFLLRLFQILKFNFTNFKLSVKWLLLKKEFTNFDLPLTENNLKHYVGFISSITQNSLDLIEQIFNELKNDRYLQEYIVSMTNKSFRGKEIINFSFENKRIGWYALIRLLKPKIVVETGTDKGFGTLIIARALEKNGFGKVITIDSDLNSGMLITNNPFNNIQRLIGNSLDLLKNINDIDVFIHDSNHEYSHELAEYEEIEKNVNPNCIVMSDNSYLSSALYDWSARNHRNFIFFAEIPKSHWYHGDGLGISTGSTLPIKSFT